MNRNYLTLEYLQKLLAFIVEEHFSFKYGEDFHKNRHKKEIQEAYECAAEVLWGNIKENRPKKNEKSAVGRRKEDESDRLKIMMYMVHHHNMSHNAAAEKVAKCFPLKGRSHDGLVRGLRNAAKKKNISLDNPFFRMSPFKETEIRIEELVKDGKNYFEACELPYILERIRKKLVE